MPPIIVFGPHGAGCTWSFNIVRELAIATYGAAHVGSGFLSNLNMLKNAPADIQQCVFKLHICSGLPEIINTYQARMLFMLRDPRDCLLSIKRRLDFHNKRAIPSDITHAGDLIEHWASNYRDIFNTPGSLIMRYEDLPFNDISAVRKIADWFPAKLSADTLQNILALHTTDKVRAYAKIIKHTPMSSKDGRGNKTDQVTLYQERHIGTASVDNWRNSMIQTQLTAWLHDRIIPILGDRLLYQ